MYFLQIELNLWHGNQKWQIIWDRGSKTLATLSAMNLRFSSWNRHRHCLTGLDLGLIFRECSATILETSGTCQTASMRRCFYTCGESWRARFPIHDGGSCWCWSSWSCHQRQAGCTWCHPTSWTLWLGQRTLKLPWSSLPWWARTCHKQSRHRWARHPPCPILIGSRWLEGE